MYAAADRRALWISISLPARARRRPVVAGTAVYES
jgi:hypothetical protein